MNSTKWQQFKNDPLCTSYLNWCTSSEIRNWPQLFERRIALSTGWITIQWIAELVVVMLILWIAIYPVDSAIQLLNNRHQLNSCYEWSTIWSRNKRETLNLSGGVLTICKKKSVGMKPFNDQFNPTGRGTWRDEPFAFSTGNVPAKAIPNKLQKA